MGKLEEAFQNLSEQHRKALLWFSFNSRTIQPWPDPLSDGTILASKAKGIYKPKWTKYALSVRQSLSTEYPDRDPIYHLGGSWSYMYHQENVDPKSRDIEYTNLGLLQCMNDKIPVGVLRQVKEKPNAKYEILGLAFITEWDNGYFFLESANESTDVDSSNAKLEIEKLFANLPLFVADHNQFNPNTITDARNRIISSIVQRRGQPQFRNKLLLAYNGKCAVTNYDAEPALDAAHIIPYKGHETNHISNGLLLRVDIHTLFDLQLLAIDSHTMKIILSNSLLNTEYRYINGIGLKLPIDKAFYPNTEALDWHRSLAGL
jgi:putative restriction endonuclease